MDEVDPFLENDKETAGNDLNNKQDDAKGEEEGTQNNLRSSPVFNTPIVRFNSNHMRQRSRMRKSTSDQPSGEVSMPVVGQSFGNIKDHPSFLENLLCSQQVETKPIVLQTSTKEVIQDDFVFCRSDSEEDIFVSLPSSSCSQPVITSAINELISCHEPADISWTSSMATPLASNVTYSNLNTEERKVLLPSEDCGVAVKPRALFSPDANDTADCHSLNISSDAEYLQNIHGEKCLKAPRLNVDVGVCCERPQATSANQECTSPTSRVFTHRNEISKGSPILSGSSEFKRTSNHSLSHGDEDLFDNVEESYNPPCQLSSHKICSAESTPNIGNKKKTLQMVIQTPTHHKHEPNNVESFLEDISVTALEEVCKAQELKNTLQPSSITPEKEKQTDTKRKRLLFSSNLAASNPTKTLFKTPEPKPRKVELTAGEVTINNVDNIIPDDSFMEHLAAMNTSIFGEELLPTTKVQSIKSSVSQMAKFSYSVDQTTEENLQKSVNKAEPKTIMKEMLSSVLALESCSSPSSSKPTTVKPTGNLVVFSQLLGEMNEVSSTETVAHSSLTTVNFENDFTKQEKHHMHISTGFQTANQNEILLSQEAIYKGFSVLKETMEGVQTPALDKSQAFKQPNFTKEEKHHMHISTGFQTANQNEILLSQEAIDKGFSVLKETMEGVQTPALDKSQAFKQPNFTKEEKHHMHISTGFQTANQNEILLSQEAIDKGFSVLKETMEGLQTPALDKSQAFKQPNIPVTSNMEIKADKLVTSSIDDNLVEEEVKELLKLVKDGEDFRPWDEFEQQGSSKSETELEIKSNVADYQTKCLDGVTDKLSIPFFGFSTANGKNIVISEDKLDQAQKFLLEAEEISANHTTKMDDCPDFQKTSGALSKSSSDRKRCSVEDKDCNNMTASKRVCRGNITSVSKRNSEQISKISTNNIFSNGTIDEPALAHLKKESVISMNISEEALNVVNNLFGNKPFSTRQKQNEIAVQSKTSGRFSGKAVIISEEAISKDKHFFDNIPVKELSQSQFQDSDSSQSKFKCTTVAACLEKEEMKGSALGIGTSCFDVSQSYSPMKRELQNVDEDVCFTTANGKKVTVSEKSIVKVKNLFNDIPSEVTDVIDSPVNITLALSFKERRDEQESILLETASDKNYNKGFSTASGKSVDISENSLNKVRNLFADIPNEGCTYLEPLDQNESRRPLRAPKEKQAKDVLNNLLPPVSPTMVMEQAKSSTKGFSTAGGKIVHVSKQAHDRVKNIFKKSDLDINCSESATSTDNSLSYYNESCGSNKEKSSVRGFSTASGKSVSISAEALKKVKGLFNEECFSSEDLELENATFPCINKGRSPNATTSRMTPFKTDNSGDPTEVAIFSTAGGKPVHVSKEAMVKAKKFFDDVPHGYVTDSKSESDIQAEIPLNYKMAGFSTAGGKSVHISKQALCKAQAFFDSSSVLEENISFIGNGKKPTETLATKPADSSVEMVGFSTAAGKAVLISKEALEKARNLLEESPSEPLNSVQNRDMLTTKVYADPKNSFNNANEIPCFTTAAGKTVQISKESLKRAECLFEELPLQTAIKEENVLSLSNRKIRLTNSVSDDSGVGLSCESTSKYLRSNTSLSRNLNVLDVSCFSNKENQNITYHLNLKTNDTVDVPKSSLTEEITASTAAFLADGEFFDDKESPALSLNPVIPIKTSPSMVSDRLSSLKPILSSAQETKSQSAEPTSPILVKSDSMGTRRRKGRLSLSSSTSLKSLSPSQGKKLVPKSRHSLPLKTTSAESPHIDNSAVNGVTPGSISVSSLCNQDITNTVSAKSDLKEASKLPPSRKLFDHGDMLSLELDTPNAKSIGIAPLRDSEATPERSNNKIHQLPKSLHQPSLVRRALTKNQNCSGSGFKTPYKTTNNKDLKRSPSSPAQNEPVTKKRKPSSNLYVAHIYNSPFEATRSGSRDLRPEVAEMRRRAADEQKQVVENFDELKGELLKPCTGNWLASRSGDVSIKLIKLSDIGQPSNYFTHELIEIGLRPATVSINADSSAEFRFSAWDYYSTDMCKENVAGLPVGDGALLVLDAQGMAGVEEFERAFLASPGVDPSLVPNGWVKNHYRWIVWKLASLERMFPHQLGKRCLSPNIVMLQLKYRYDREIDRCQRPALRRILEQDDSAAKRIVFCVAGIVGEKDSSRLQVELELTDGWYSVMATIDLDMQYRVKKGMIKVGTKLITHGAELLNCSEACSPLQARPDIRLKLCSNSTRRARWYTKLGFHDNPGPMKISLASVLSSGGAISCFSAYVARVYPVVYMEKTEERTVVRSQRAESKEVAKSERKKQQLAEVVYSQVQNELHLEQSKKKSKIQKLSFKNLPSISSGEELCDILENSADPLSIQCMLSEEQKDMISDYQRRRQEELRSEMEAKVRLRLSEKSDCERQVTAILKVRLLDCNGSCSAMLSVWRPSEDVASVFKEGLKITIFGAVASGMRCGDLQLSASRSTRYQVGNPSEIRSDLVRTVFPLDSLTQNTILPRFGELDVVGIVIKITPTPQTSENTTHFQTAYVSDSQHNIIGITFREGIKMFAVEDLITPRAFIAASNLQWRVGSGNRAIPSLYVSEFSFFSTNPKPLYLQSALKSLRRSISNDLKIFCKICEDKLESILLQNYSTPVACSKPPNAAQSPSLLTDQNTSSPSSAFLHQIPSYVSSDEKVNSQQILSAETHIQGSSNAVPSPAVEKRIAKLEKYGEAPPISPILICQPRRSLKKAFKAPRRTDSPSTLNLKKKNE